MNEQSLSKTTVVLGASDKHDRYSYKAITALLEAGHRVIPVNPVLAEIEGVPVVKSLPDITEEVHTLTMYVNPMRSSPIIDQIAGLKPQRIIFNPGTENPELERRLKEQGVEVVIGCTLVMLASGQY